jgi:multidrug resistance efflux pump
MVTPIVVRIRSAMAPQMDVDQAATALWQAEAQVKLAEAQVKQFKGQVEQTQAQLDQAETQPLLHHGRGASAHPPSLL